MKSISSWRLNLWNSDRIFLAIAHNNKQNNICIKYKVNTQTIVNDKAFAHVVFPLWTLPLLLTIGSARVKQELLREIGS